MHEPLTYSMRVKDVLLWRSLYDGQFFLSAEGSTLNDQDVTTLPRIEYRAVAWNKTFCKENPYLSVTCQSVRWRINAT